METESSISHLQEPSTCPYTEPDQSSPYSHITPWRYILILYSHLRLGLSSGFFLRLPHQNPICTSPVPISAMCTAHIILLDLFTLIIFDEEYRSLSSSLYSFPHSPVTSSLLGPKTLLNTLFSNTLILRFSLKCERLRFTPIQNNRQNYGFVYLWKVNWKTEDSAPNNSKHSRSSICP